VVTIKAVKLAELRQETPPAEDEPRIVGEDSGAKAFIVIR
jgi:hypothetical protein